MTQPRVVFMGTPDFAVPTLQKLHALSQVKVVGVVTQPDRKAGRGRKLLPPPVKIFAERAGLTVLQPKSLREAEALARLRELAPDVIVVAAFGQILRPAVLNLPPFGCLNVHASLLPRWRGAAPVAYAIKAGDSETGISLMQMDPGLDTGPVLSQQAIAITAQHTRASLSEDLAHLGATLMAETLPAWLAGEIQPQVQDDAQATLAPKIEKDEGRLNWHLPAVEIDRHVRAFSPWPGTFTYWQGSLLKIHAVTPVPTWTGSAAPGTVLELNGSLGVATGQGAVQLEQLQLAGKRAVPAADFQRGVSNFIGSSLQAA